MEWNRIYNEDNLKTMGRMQDNSVDLIITSPPYNKGAYAPDKGTSGVWGAMKGRRINYDSYDDAMDPSEYEDWQKKVISECIRVLKPSGSLFYNHKDILHDGVSVVPRWVYDYNVRQQIIWDRGSSPALDSHYLFPVTEYIYWIVKDPKKTFFDKDKVAMKSTIWRMQPDKNPHPAPFPKVMVDNIILGCCPDGGLVYDPFIGSGTVAASVLSIGCVRNYIGSEKSSHYVNMATKRLSIIKSEPKLF